ncbi:MAG TPA: D-alanyl-D-alanine carboxypeptidase [Candidatus Blautia stercorigallinarum]|uniref:D-alanyl-D-alanine carboxypeptidase n=1 Tax=Candidatus Blautia stercorigallinarum TaxID=2838501 RepID=A0A9D1PCX6_9FIRM|nr:D-alanyl-D-alanine carboxypeptidase [Candidatus Blautia stercorigallinarum]
MSHIYKGGTLVKKSVLPKPLLCISLALTLLFGSFSTVQATDFPKSWPQAPEITEETGVLMEASTGQILFDKSMDEIRYPASTTKVMTALLILENVEDLSQIVTFTDVITPDLAPGNSTINARVGEQLTVEQCLYAIMLASANEVCTQMAVYVAGSVENFVSMMNERAQELGCQNTHFVNANGLPDPNHYTTAHDLALILAAAIQNEDFCRISGSATYTIPATNMTDSPRNLENSNGLIKNGKYHYEGVIAGKTGHTEAAKNTLVTAASRDGMTLVCVVLRSDGEDRFIDTVNLFDYGFDNFHLSPVYWMDREEPAGYVALPKGVESNVLTVKDSDGGNVRTRTYSYQGTEVYRTQVNLPVTFDSSEASVSFTPLFYQVKGIDFLLPVMIGITGILCIAEFSLIFLSIIKRRK